MELRDIEIFLTLAEELHFGRTAERLRVTQARVSQSIAKQERRIGAALFERTSRRVTLTPVGAQLHAELSKGYQQILDGLDAAAALAKGHTGALSVGIMGAMAHVIAPVIGRFRAQYPGAELRIREAHFSDPFGPLRSGEVDVQLLWAPVREPDLTVGPVVLTERRAIAVPVGHPLADRDTVSLEDLGDYLLFDPAPPAPAYWVEGMLPSVTPSGRPVRRGPVVSTFQEVLALVAAGVAITPVNEHVMTLYQRPDIVYRLIADAPPNDWVLVWRTSGETALVKAFAQAARDAALS